MVRQFFFKIAETLNMHGFVRMIIIQCSEKGSRSCQFLRNSVEIPSQGGFEPIN